MRRRSIKGAGAIAAIALLGLALPGSALAGAEPNGHASCLGIEMAAISPPGSSDEEPGGARQLGTEIKEIADSFSMSAGRVFAFVASLHAGSHAECDAALEG